ncbi:MAG TPA: Rieske 2Fe-2S domain-containing protein [Ktedonobacteraceae bacterium]|jgi:Rieske Fe-S protein|nr:Rieske 2Fe-2S domain-containing protein [Ktedonobacteraceae bacterium]
MSGEDQERFEDYLELEHFIEELQAGRVAHPPEELTPEKARIYRMAALFRSASPEEATPRPEFVADLQARLEQELQQPSKKRIWPFGTKRPRVSRRALLAGGAAAAAASLAIGAGIDHIVEESKQPVAANSWAEPLVPANAPAVWHDVNITVAQLGDQAVRFETSSLVGYLIRDDGDGGDPDKGKIIAMSAACTHMGCIVQWNSSDRRYHCPCHGGVFTEYGKADNNAGYIRYLQPLPRLETRVDSDGKIYVRVPAPKPS